MPRAGFTRIFTWRTTLKKAAGVSGWKDECQVQFGGFQVQFEGFHGPSDDRGRFRLLLKTAKWDQEKNKWIRKNKTPQFIVGIQDEVSRIQLESA